MLPLPSLFSLIGLLQLFDLDFAHLQNGLRHAIRFLSVLVLHHLADVRGNDLPRNAEFVPEPAALFGSPPSESFFQSSSISFCVPQFAMNEMARENLKCGPPFNARNSCPSPLPPPSLP